MFFGEFLTLFLQLFQGFFVLLYLLLSIGNAYFNVSNVYCSLLLVNFVNFGQSLSIAVHINLQLCY